MANPKQYIPRSQAREIATKFGPLLKLNFHADSLVAFVNEKKNARGYITFAVSPRKTPDEKSTHSVYLDDFVPQGGAAPQRSAPQPAPSSPGDSEADQVPF